MVDQHHYYHQPLCWLLSPIYIVIKSLYDYAFQNHDFTIIIVITIIIIIIKVRKHSHTIPISLNGMVMEVSHSFSIIYHHKSIIFFWVIDVNHHKSGESFSHNFQGSHNEWFLLENMVNRRCCNQDGNLSDSTPFLARIKSDQ